jgi:predicted GIY-YIG superfamily endonuclease
MRHVYIVRCSDDTLYTGIAKDLEKRIADHNGSKV